MTDYTWHRRTFQVCGFTVFAWWVRRETTASKMRTLLQSER